MITDQKTQPGSLQPDCSLSARQRVLSGQRLNWRVGQLIAFVHGPGRKNIYRFRVEEMREGRPYKSRLTANEKLTHGATP